MKTKEQKGKKRKRTKNDLLFVMKHFKINWFLAILAVVLSVVASTQSTKVPDETSKLFDSTFEMSKLFHVLGITVTAALISFCGTVVSSFAAAGAVRSLQKSIWKKMMNVGIEYYDVNDPTKQVSLETNDAESVGSGIITVLTYIPTMLVTIGMSLVTLFSYNTKLLGILWLIMPMNILYLVFVGRWQESVGRRGVLRVGYLTGYLAERIRNLMMIKVFTAEDKERANGRHAAEELYKLGKESSVLASVVLGFASVSNVISTVATVIWGCHLLRNGEVTQPQFIAFSMYVPMINLAFSMISIVWNFLKGFVGASHRMAGLFAAEDEKLEDKGTAAEEISGSLRFDKVEFTYLNADQKTLKGLDFTIPEKKVTAIVGPSGSGKSTIIKLIEQLYQPESGSITMGGADVGSLAVSGWRERIAYVAQDSGLFSGTIRSAVTYGVKREISDAELNRVMEQVSLTEFIASLPEGYDTKLENWGSSLSGGQRQRIAIARALLKDAQVYIFDEPTSALDPDAADSISDLIFSRFGDKTVIIISHELGYIASADHIIVINGGRQEGEGTHGELMERCRVYRNLVEEQSYQEVFE